jgi:hypothetical protein
MQKKALVGMVLVLVALVLMGISLAMPWYKWEMKMSSGGESETSGNYFYLDHLETDFAGLTNEVSYDEEGMENSSFVDTFETTQTMVYVGVVGCIIGMVGATLVMVQKMNRSIGAILVLIAVVLTILAPFYLMVSLPGSFKEDFGSYLPNEKIGTDFSGSEKNETDLLGVTFTQELSWGGDTGWFLPIIAMALCVLAMILVSVSKPAIVPFAVQEPLPAPMAAQPATPVTFQTEAQAPVITPGGAQPGEQFQCPQCSRIFILATAMRPAVLNCPYCGLEGLVE